MFSALKVRDFRIYWFGMLVSLVGTWIQTVTQSWLVFKLTNSTFLLGLAGFLGLIPVFLFSLLGGVVADRFNKRKILIWTQSIFMLLAFILAIMTQFDLITPVQIMAIAFLNGTVMAFDAPARQAVIVELSGKQHLLNAIALNSAAFNSGRIIGPALAGLLVASIGISGCFYINGLSFTAVIAALLAIRNNHRAGETGRDNGLFGDIAEGIDYIKNHRDISVLIAMVGVISLFGLSYMILMPIFASDVLRMGVKGFGLLMSSAGIGALIAALLLARSRDLRYKGRYMIFSSMVLSLGLILFSLSRIYLLSVFMLAIIGWSSVTAVSLINNSLQMQSDDKFRGRVMGIFMITFAGMVPFGNLISGCLAQILGVWQAVMICGIILFAGFSAATIFSSRIRSME